MRRAAIVAVFLMICQTASGQWWRRATQTAVAKTQTAGASNTATPTRTFSPTPIASLTATQTAKTATPAVTVAAVPAVPTGLTASATSSTAVVLWWNASANATGYSVQKWDGAVAVWITQGQTTQTGWSTSGLAPGSTQYFRVAAYNGSGSSAYCAWVSVVMPYATAATATPTRTMTMTPAPVSTSTPTFSPSVPPTPTLTPSPAATPTLGIPNVPTIAVTPEADGSITVQIQGQVPPEIAGFKIDRCDGGALADGTCPTGWHQVADVPLTPVALVSPMAGFAHPGILAVIGGGMLAALFLYGKWRRRR